MARSALMHPNLLDVRWYSNNYPPRGLVLSLPCAAQFLAQVPSESLLHMIRITGGACPGISVYNPHEWVIQLIQYAPVAVISAFLRRFYPNPSRGVAHHVAVGLLRRSPADVALFAADPTLLVCLRMGKWASFHLMTSRPDKHEHVNAFLALACAGGTTDTTLIAAAIAYVTGKFGAAAALRGDSEHAYPLPTPGGVFAYARLHYPVRWAQLWHESCLRSPDL
jgi:hypothetical protein